MFAFIVRRLLQSVLVMLAVALVSFGLFRYIGDPIQNMVGQDFLFSGEWWIVMFPGLALLMLALSVNLPGDWLRDALNPRPRGW